MNHLTHKPTPNAHGYRIGSSGTVEHVPARGRVYEATNVRVLPSPPTQLTTRSRDHRTRWERIRPWLTGTAIALAIGAVAGLVWFIVLAIMVLIALVITVITWITTHLALIAVIGISLLLLGTGGAARCKGMHCPGCRR